MVDVEELEQSWSMSLFCTLPTSVCLFGFKVACASVVGSCASFLFVWITTTME